MKYTYIFFIAIISGFFTQASDGKSKVGVEKSKISIQAAVLPQVPSHIRGIASYEIVILPEGGHQVTTVFSGGDKQVCFVDKDGNTRGSEE